MNPAHALKGAPAAVLDIAAKLIVYELTAVKRIIYCKSDLKNAGTTTSLQLQLTRASCFVTPIEKFPILPFCLVD